MDTFFEKHNLPKLIQNETDAQDRLTSIKEV